MRECRDCHKRLPLDSFPRHRKTKGGRAYQCKECQKEYRRRKKAENPEHIRRLARQRWQRWRDRNNYVQKQRPPRRVRRARELVSAAIKKGTMERPTSCQVCGGGGQIVGHHEDYDAPLVVAWLCRSCHWYVHNQGWTQPA